MAKLVSNLARIAKRIGPECEKALLATGKDVYDISQQFVPVDKGKLKASGGVVPVSSSHVQVGYGIEGSEREDVAIYQEYGTVEMPAQPYLTPAFEQSVSTFEERLTQAMRNAVTG